LGHRFTTVPLMLQASALFTMRFKSRPCRLLLPIQCRTLPSAPLHTGSCTGPPTRHVARTWGSPSACCTPCTRGALPAHPSGAAPHTGAEALPATTPGAQGCQHRRAEAKRALLLNGPKLGAPHRSAGDCDGTACRQGSSGSHRHAPAADQGARGRPRPTAARRIGVRSRRGRSPPLRANHRLPRAAALRGLRRATPRAAERYAHASVRLNCACATAPLGLSGWHSLQERRPRCAHSERSSTAAAAAAR